MVAERGRDLDQLLAAEVLVILDRQRQSGVGDVRRLPPQRGSRMHDHVVPRLPERRTTSFQHRRQVKAQDRCPDGLRAAHRRSSVSAGRWASQKLVTTVRSRSDSPGAASSRCERRQPAVIELDAAHPCILRERDEARPVREAWDWRVASRRPAARACRRGRMDSDRRLRGIDDNSQLPTPNSQTALVEQRGGSRW